MKTAIPFRTSTFVRCTLAIAMVASFGQANFAQEENPVLVARAYRLGDVLAEVNQYEFNGVFFPGLGGGGGVNLGGGFQGGGFGGGGMGAAGGGGVFSIPDQIIHDATFTRPTSMPQFGGFSGSGFGGGFGSGRDEFEISISDIEDAISNLLESMDDDSWADSSTHQLGSTLIVSTTEANHRLIEQHIAMIREAVSRTARSVTVKINWLHVDDATYRSLNPESSQGVLIVERAKIDALADQGGGSGTITCFDGQTVHLISGQMKDWIKSVTPVVGMNTLQQPMQVASSTTTPGPTTQNISRRAETKPPAQTGNPVVQQVGFQPVTDTINHGALIQVSPMIVPGANAAIVDVHSNVILPMNAVSQETVDVQNVIKLDRLNVKSHQFQTSLRLPLNQPVIIGGSTVQIGRADSAICVVIEIVGGE